MLGSDNYAFCRTEGERILEVREKQPFTDDKMSEFASAGNYYFKKGIYIKGAQGDAQIDTDVTNKEL